MGLISFTETNLLCFEQAIFIFLKCEKNEAIEYLKIKLFLFFYFVLVSLKNPHIENENLSEGN